MAHDDEQSYIAEHESMAASLAKAVKENSKLKTENEQLNRSRSGLVGKFFHEWKNENIEHQGCITEEIGSDTFLVLLFSWLDGNPSRNKIISLEEMKRDAWSFYETAEEMISAYECLNRGRK